MIWSTSVLTPLSSDTEPTIIVTFDRAKYIFNIGENTNRAFLQSDSNWKRTKGLFFTDIGTKRCTGLPGLLMTFADATIPRLHIVGPPGLLHLMSSMRMYIYRDSLNISPVESSCTPSRSPEPLFKDENITVYGIPILPLFESQETTVHSHPESSVDTIEAGQKRKRETSPYLPGKRQALDSALSPSSGQSPDPPALLRGEAADDWRRRMIELMFPGTIVKPKKVLRDRDSPPTPRPRKKDRNSQMDAPRSVSPKSAEASENVSFILEPPMITTHRIVIVILDIPTVKHIPALTAAFEDPFYARFRSHRPEDFKDNAVRSVFHLLGKDVLEDPRYIEFMNGFSSNTHHIISSREHSPDPVTFTSSALSQLRMNQLDPEIFPIPHYSLTSKRDLKLIPNIPQNSSILTAGLEVNMRTSNPPTIRELNDSFHKLVTSDKPIVLSQETSKLFSQAKRNVQEHIARGKLHVPTGSDVKVIPLGTGSAIPTKYRNVSSTLIQIPNWGNILLDAGEGTWGQLVRQFGIDDGTENNVWDVLRDIKCIYVSHIHGDHHMGLAQLLAKRRELNPPPSSPLYLVTIRSVHLYVRELSEIQNLGLDDPSGNGVIPILSESIHWKNAGVYQTHGMWQIGGSEPWTDVNLSLKNAAALCKVLGLERFNTVDVRHRTRCYGAVFKHTDGWSVVFSADTEPSSSLTYAGKEATLLVHEATMADDQEHLAAQKAHSTFGQALDIGRRMRAEHILLTHFSARYPRMPPSALRRPQNGDFRPIVALAFDHANFKIGDMWKTSYYLKALEQSFRETVAEEGDEEEEVEANVMAGMDIAVD
ncbi:Zinc phosphodiesterase ELAC protein 2 [Termitomyces sp. J132]|nr:Zinc phosphodiesterase ELAC protein 2 [Termitomyces sp. J132]